MTKSFVTGSGSRNKGKVSPSKGLAANTSRANKDKKKDFDTNIKMMASSIINQDKESQKSRNQLGATGSGNLAMKLSQGT